MEPVSLALGIVPLLVSAAENYRKVYGVVQNFNRYSGDVKRLERVLRSQSLHFEEHRRALLTHCLDDDTGVIDEMLSDAAHPQWDSESLKLSLWSALGNSCERYYLIVHAIVEESTRLKSRVDRHRRPNVGRRLLFALTKKDYNGDISALRNLLLDLASIRLERHQPSQGLLRKEAGSAGPGRLPSDQPAPQAASLRNVPQDLYDALANACNEHPEHTAHLHLEICRPQADGSVLFELGMRAERRVPEPQQSTTWLKIISHNTSIPDNAFIDGELGGLVANLRLPTSTTPDVCATTGAPPQPKIEMLETSVNLCKEGRFCSKLKQASTGAMQQDLCLGYVEDSNACKHAVFTMPRRLVTAVEEAALSLRILLSVTQQEPLARRLSQFERYRLARQISGAILQLSNTSWVDCDISAEQIYLYGFEDDEACGQYSATLRPYLDVLLSENRTRCKGKGKTTLPSTIRNALLFRLGVILLELAFEKPLHELRSPEDLSEGRENTSIDWHTAARSSRPVSAKMGRRYSKVVERCLWCSFACGESELDSPTLQRNAYRDVVGELEDLERAKMEILGY